MRSCRLVTSAASPVSAVCRHAHPGLGTWSWACDDPSVHIDTPSNSAVVIRWDWSDVSWRATNYGDLDPAPPNSPIDKTFFQAAGVEPMTASCAGRISAKRQIMNQSDIFYFSGHGDHKTANLYGGFSPGDVAACWNKDIEVAIIAGCPVMSGS